MLSLIKVAIKGLFLTGLLLFSVHGFSYTGSYHLLSNKQLIFIYENEAPLATLVLFAGGNGYLGLQKNGSVKKLKNNFLLRSIPLFLKENFRVVVYEAPLNKTPLNKASSQSLLGGYRLAEEHANDVAVVVNYLREHYSEAIWLIGTSRGANSVANAAASLGDKIDGIVLSAPLTEKNKKGGHVLNVDLSAISVPVYLVSHKKDRCWVTPPNGLKRIEERLSNAPAIELRIMSDSLTTETKGRACGGLSAHGFLGVEESLIRNLSSFILRQLSL